jgi:type IV secretory pathway TraG/TraD family ATPase VirD4
LGIITIYIHNSYIRGAKLLEAGEFRRCIKETVSLPLGREIKMPYSAEIKHTFILGRPGTGKTNAINQMLSVVKKRNNKAIIYDYKGDFLPKFYDENTDLIYNVLDKRGLGWNIFNDIESMMDLEAIANSIIPSAPKNTDPTWYNVPRDILRGILLYCHVNNRRTNRDVWEILKLGAGEIGRLLRNTPGAERAGIQLGEDSTNETTNSLMMMLMQYAKIFDFLQYTDGDFSVKKWVQSENNNFIFITNYANVKDALKPAISLFIETVGRSLLSEPDDIDRRLFMFIDEFGTLQKLDTIVDLLTASRSKGGAIFLGIQDIGRIDSIYGKEARESIINACGNNLIFAVEDFSTAEFASKKLGHTEYYEHQQSQSYGDNSERINVNQHKRHEFLVLASEIQALKDLTAYLKVANVGITFTEYNYKNFENLNEAFIMREQFKLFDYDSIQELEKLDFYEERVDDTESTSDLMTESEKKQEVAKDSNSEAEVISHERFKPSNRYSSY